jgi:tryptophanyl-tRNA synthetase
MDNPPEPSALTILSLASQSGNEEAENTESQDQDVNPFSVSGGVVNGVAQAIDYDKLIDRFGTKRIDQVLLERFERVTGKRPHKFMRRGIVFSHRDLESILDRYEAGKPFYLYTGRGPSSGSVHLGHMVPFGFTL